MQADPLQGAALLADEFSLPEVWLALHRSGVTWAQLSGQMDAKARQAQITASDRNLLRLLSDVPYDRWASLCLASGVTTTALLASGWTKDADLPAIALHWGALLQLQSQPFALSARLVPVHLLPEFTHLTAAVRWAGDNLALLALAIYAQPGMVIDMPPNSLTNAPPLVASALALRLGN